MEECKRTISRLFEEYAGQPQMLDYLRSRVCETLPSVLLDHAAKTAQRAERLSLLDEACLQFSTIFLSTHDYYRCMGSGCFVEYDGRRVKYKDEDDIQYEVLSAISADKTVTPRKHKTKAHIMKCIKSRSILELCPEEETVNSALTSLSPAFFLTGNGAKHFLIAVGEALLGTTPHIYICPPVLRQLYRVIDDAAAQELGLPSALSHFKKKYHGHDYKSLRFFDVDSSRGPASVPSDISKHVLDYLVVAVHLARTWGSSDAFVDEAVDPQLVQHIKHASSRTRAAVIEEFLETTLLPCAEASITASEAWFSLRQFFCSRNLPVLLFQDELHTHLRSKLGFDGKHYIGRTSTYLPEVRAFETFWTSYMRPSDSPFPLGIESLTLVFRQNTKRKRYKTSASFVRALVEHLYPAVVLKNNNILGYECLAWNKLSDIKDVCSAVSEPDNRTVTPNYLYNEYLASCHVPKVSAREFHSFVSREFPSLVKACRKT